MKTSEPKKIQTIHDWLKTPLGQYMLNWEEKHFQTLSADIFGFNALQIGFTEINALKENRIKNRWFTNLSLPEPLPPKTPKGSSQFDTSIQKVPISLVHEMEELPFASQSIDLIILPHVFEFAKSPHQILREVERILIPEGQVIISGFNPTSLWGLRQKFGKLSGSHFLPDYAEFISLSRLKDWLKLLNFEINRGHFGCYRPPCKTAGGLNHFAFMEPAGNRWWPYFGAIYLIQAIKRVHGIHLLINPVIINKPARIFQTIPANNKTSRQNSGQT